MRSMANVLCAFWQEHSIIHTTDTTVCNNSVRVRCKQGSLAYLQRKIMYFPLLCYKNKCGFSPFTSQKGALGDKGLILSSKPSEDMENNLRGRKGREKK